MERMSGIDAGFLYVETPAQHMHTIKVAVLEPTPGWDASLASLSAAMQARMHLLLPLRRRVLAAPLGLHHPVWIDDPDLDLANHLHLVVAPPPGGASELDALVSEIAETPLDRDRPLWELWLVTGLAEGRIAAVAKVHHCVADGVAIAALLAKVMWPESASPADAALAGAPATASPHEVVPGRATLARQALGTRLRSLRRLPGLAAKTARNLAAVARRRRIAAVPGPRPMLDAPRTPFNGALGARRRFASSSLSLDQVRLVRAALGVTVNDVLLGLVAGSLRSYLVARRALPRRSLIAEVPVSTDASGAAERLSGNHVANIFTSLYTDVADPLERLQRIHDGMVAGKETNRLLGPELFEEWAEHTPGPALAWLVRGYSRWRVADLLPPPINAIVSCVPGPRARLRWAEGRLHALYSVGPLVHGVGVNVTAWSYVDRLEVGVLTCPDLLPDPREVAGGMHAALAELLAAVAASPGYDAEARRAAASGS
jgi:WS/DGAT/MGAT family acyltransferase